MTLKTYANRVVAILGATFISVGLAPELLAFPYHRDVGDTSVYSEKPIAPAIERVIAKSDVLLRASPIFGPGYGRRIFLTDGSWRWTILSPLMRDAFAHSRPVSEAIVVNASDVDRDSVTIGATIGGRRSLSGVIAHERTHGLIRARFGLLSGWTMSTWKAEGYCDYVAASSSLSDRQVVKLRHEGRSHPAMIYYIGRKRVAEILRTNGNKVERLFDGSVP